MKKMLATIIISSALVGCATQTFTINGEAGLEPDKEVMQTFFVSGLGQEKEMNAAQVCGGADKIAKVETHLRFIDGLLSSLTWGIYTPRTAKVFCTK